MSDRPATTVSSSSAASETVAPVLPGMAEEEADDPNEYFEPEPVDPTIDELKVRVVCAVCCGLGVCVVVRWFGGSAGGCMHACIHVGTTSSRAGRQAGTQARTRLPPPPPPPHPARTEYTRR